jgi:hypothetical protein
MSTTDSVLEPFDPTPILKYLDLPSNYTPSPVEDPISFISSNLRLLPPHLIDRFSLITTPKQRTSIPQIRNRRLRWTQSAPKAISYPEARTTWPTLWRGTPEARGARQAADASDERAWVEQNFFAERAPHVRKLGELLAGYEEERSWERSRAERRQQADEDFVPEEDESSEEELEEGVHPTSKQSEPEEQFEESKEAFERLIKERLIYGLLDVCWYILQRYYAYSNIALKSVNYDAIDWDESLDDADDRDAEERWFDDDDSD